MTITHTGFQATRGAGSERPLFRRRSPRAEPELGTLEKGARSRRRGPQPPGRGSHAFQVGPERVGEGSPRGGPGEHAAAAPWPCPREPRARASGLGAGEGQPPNPGRRARELVRSRGSHPRLFRQKWMGVSEGEPPRRLPVLLPLAGPPVPESGLP